MHKLRNMLVVSMAGILISVMPVMAAQPDNITVYREESAIIKEIDDDVVVLETKDGNQYEIGREIKISFDTKGTDNVEDDNIIRINP